MWYRHGVPAPTPHLVLLLTCSSTTDRQQRVRFFIMLLGRPRVAKELQSWLLFLPSVERKECQRQGPTAPQVPEGKP